jgi:hypothetical protein
MPNRVRILTCARSDRERERELQRRAKDRAAAHRDQG